MLTLLPEPTLTVLIHFNSLNKTNQSLIRNRVNPDCGKSISKNRLKFLSLAWVTALCCLQPVKADEAPPAMNTRPAINVAELSQKASTGDVAAQVTLANAYFYGKVSLRTIRRLMNGIRKQP